MRGHRVTVTLYLLTMLVLVPPCFVLLRVIPEVILSSFVWDNTITDWMDKTFQLSSTVPTDGGGIWQRTISGGSHRWLVDLGTIPLLVWCVRFISGALEEFRHTHKATLLHLVEIMARWFALSMTLPLCIPVLSTLLYHSLRIFQIWEPLALLSAVGSIGFLSFWSWQYPNRRVKHVEKVFHFERLKSEV